MPISSAPGPRGPAGRRDPVRPATPPRRTTGGHRRGARSFAPAAGPTCAAAGRYRSRWSDPALPTTVWLLTAPAAPVTQPAVSCPREAPEVPGSVGGDGVAEIVCRAVAAFVPETSRARRGPTIVVTRHAHAASEAMAGDPNAPGPPPDVSPGTVPQRAACTTPTGIGETTAGDPLVAGAGVGLVLLDATRTPGVSVGVDDLAVVLAPGGVLAVVTSSDRVAGRLRDPRPALIASARAAGLDYWQHIVTTTRPADYPQERPGADSDEYRSSDGDGQERPTWCLVADISVFRRPAPADRVDAPAQGVTTTEVQP